METLSDCIFEPTDDDLDYVDSWFSEDWWAYTHHPFLATESIQPLLSYIALILTLWNTG